MTPAAALGILKRRIAYLTKVAHGRRSMGKTFRHEEQEIAALTLAIEALEASTPVAPVTPSD